jgi:ubiquinol oxidase
MNAVTIAHRDTRNWSDRVAKLAARTLRLGLDFVSGYKRNKAVALNAKEGPAAAQAKYGMTEKKYLIRNIFLESVAGVSTILFIGRNNMLNHILV